MIEKINSKAIYNYQFNNPAKQGIKGGSQCGPTSVCQTLSIADKKYAEDYYVEFIVDSIEGENGFLREKILDKYRFTGRLIYHGESYFITLQQIIKIDGLQFKAGWVPTGGTVEQIKNIIDKDGAVLLSTMIVQSGHFITVVGYQITHDDFILVCNDPAGNILKGKYPNQFGEHAQYSMNKMGYLFRQSSHDGKSLRFSYMVPA